MRIEIHLTHHCNLNCKYCSHFSSIADKWELDPIDFENDLKSIDNNILNSFDHIKLLGGEPLLNKHINDILIIARKYFKHKITILTNGILLSKMPDKFYKICKDNNIEITYTKYPIIYDKIKTFIKSLKDKGVNIYQQRNGSIFNYRKYNLEGNIDPNKSFQNCTKGLINEMNCMQLVGTKLFRCYRIPYIWIFNKKFNQNLEITKDDYLDLKDVIDSNDIIKYISTPKPFCKYCEPIKVDNNKVDFEISKKEITEWT